MEREKACPIVIRSKNGKTEILCFSHPLAGVQLVKGSIEPNESPEQACVRELREEAGLSLECKKYLTLWNRSPLPNWHLCLMDTAENLAEEWDHFCLDDGGHVFSFFWQPIDDRINANLGATFVEALEQCKGLLP